MTETYAVAVAEFRSLLRAVQTWVVLAVAVAAGLAPFLYYSAAHGIRSGYGPTAGSAAPRFLIHGFGDLTLLAIMAGVVLLAMDAFARDRRDGIADVAFAKPSSNLSLLVGRTAALALAGWLAPVLLALATFAVGGAARATGFWTGDFVEPWSLAGFLLLDAPAALVSWTALVVLLRVAMGPWPAAAAAFALLVVQAWALFALPAWLQPVVSLLPRFGEIASDVLPQFATIDAIAQRFALALLAGGALCLAAAVLARRRRRDDRAPARAAAGAVLASLGAILLGLLLAEAVQARSERTGWIAVHQERQGAASFHIERIEARIAIDPGRELRLDATMRVRAQAQKDALLFRFNPGMEIAHIRAGGETLDHRHESGLLDVRLSRPLAAGEAAELSLAAAGVPDPRFAYLDEALDPSALALADSLLHTLGTRASIFERHYAALLPGAAWLPAAGSGFGADQDFFELSLDVDLPQGWLVAGPGVRTESPAPGGGTRFGFRPPAPVTEVAVLASSRFERRAASVAGVDAELLLHRQHMRNIAFFGDIAEQLREQLQYLLEYDAGRGLPDPYGSLSFVEVPAHLRGFGGGERMGAALAAPGIVMIRELGSPTARFDFVAGTPRFVRIRADAEDRGDFDSSLLLILAGHLESARSGVDLRAGLARDRLRFRTGVRGTDAARLDLLLDALAYRMQPFSALAFAGAGRQSLGVRLVSRTMADTTPVHNALVDRHIRAASPGGGSALDAAYRQAAALAKLIEDWLGAERISALLADLLHRFDGRTFAMGDFLAAVGRLDAALASILEERLRSGAPPGFLHSSLEVVRMADDERGRPRYLSRLRVRNDEPAPGVVRLVLAILTPDYAIPHPSEPIRIGGGEAVEIEQVTPSQPILPRLHTYESLNRDVIVLDAPERGDPIPQVDDEPSGVRPTTWRPAALAGVVVDDLGAGFAVRGIDAPAHLVDALATDEGSTLAELWWDAPQGRWGRQPVEWGWGKYRATVVAVAHGDGTEEAVFAAELPTAGRWRLHYHVPSDRPLAFDGPEETRRWQGPQEVTALYPGFWGHDAGTYRLRLSAGADEFDIAFDADKAEYGWNLLGEFTLDAGPASLAVSSQSDGGTYVVADAVWWEPRATGDRAAQ